MKSLSRFLIIGLATFATASSPAAPKGGGGTGGGTIYYNQDLFRVPATGGTWVNLTNTPAPFRESIHESQGRWR